MKTILEEAHALVYGERQEQYGDPMEQFTRVAQAFNELHGEQVIEGADIALILVLLKLQRQLHQSKRDNLVDAAGYTAIMAILSGHEAQHHQPPLKPSI